MSGECGYPAILACGPKNVDSVILSVEGRHCRFDDSRQLVSCVSDRTLASSAEMAVMVFLFDQNYERCSMDPNHKPYVPYQESILPRRLSFSTCQPKKSTGLVRRCV